MKNFAIIVPVYQNASIFSLFLESLQDTLTCGNQIIFINDGSSDIISEMINNFRPPNCLNAQITLLRHETPRGCSKSINEGLRAVDASADFVMLLDSDLILQKGWQEAVEGSFATDENVGIVGGILLYPQTGGIQCCGISFQASSGKHLFLNANPTDLAIEKHLPIQTTVFAFCALRSGLVRQVGEMDEHFFNGYEDWDYIFRARRLGYQAVINTGILAYHWEKSNGVHRELNRKSNLGRFWRKHGEFVRDDLFGFVQLGLAKHVADQVEYVIIDLCENRDLASQLTLFLRQNKNIHIHSVLDYSTQIGNNATIWLPQVLRNSALHSNRPYLFLCEQVVCMLDNHYWWKWRARYCREDLVVDLSANVLPFEKLSTSFWPGTKIR